MKLLPLALLASAALATSSAHAEHISFRGFFRFGGPVCPPPAYCPPPDECCPPAPVFCPPRPYCPPPVPAGYWKDVCVNVWIPERRVTEYDAYGCPVTYCQPGHYETRHQRVWVRTCEPDDDDDRGGWRGW